ncbi:unnamed protein product [Linum trigynum]|uniref:Uncharacterized protein n=1 Tax=Linum trigynum TaxID=586398 RepID=A0AAV2GF30_9ROSI
MRTAAYSKLQGSYRLDPKTCNICQSPNDVVFRSFPLAAYSKLQRSYRLDPKTCSICQSPNDVVFRSLPLAAR